MRRRLFTLAAALSLLLCVASLTLCIRSYSGSDAISRRRLTAASPHAVEHRAHQLQWTLGQIRFLDRHDTLFLSFVFTPHEPSPDASKPHWSYFRYGPGHLGSEGPAPKTPWNRLGFATWHTGWASSFDQSYDRVWAIPAWLPVAPLAAPPTIWALAAHKRRRRRRLGLCVACGYDLRATPTRCPECGAV